MEIKKDLLEKEIEQWTKYYNNFDNLSIQIMADVLAYYKKEDRAEMIKKVDGFLENVSEPITGELMVDSIKGDVESFDRINNESAVALRTLEWIKSIEDVKEAEIEEIEEKVIDKE